MMGVAVNGPCLECGRMCTRPLTDSHRHLCGPCSGECTQPMAGLSCAAFVRESRDMGMLAPDGWPMCTNCRTRMEATHSGRLSIIGENPFGQISVVSDSGALSLDS